MIRAFTPDIVSLNSVCVDAGVWCGFFPQTLRGDANLVFDEDVTERQGVPGVQSGDRLYFTCEDGTRVSRNPLTCSPSGQWGTPYPTCGSKHISPSCFLVM